MWEKHIHNILCKKSYKTSVLPTDTQGNALVGPGPRGRLRASCSRRERCWRRNRAAAGGWCFDHGTSPTSFLPCSDSSIITSVPPSYGMNHTSSYHIYIHTYVYIYIRYISWKLVDIWYHSWNITVYQQTCLNHDTIYHIPYHIHPYTSCKQTCFVPCLYPWCQQHAEALHQAAADHARRQLAHAPGAPRALRIASSLWWIHR